MAAGILDSFSYTTSSSNGLQLDSLCGNSNTNSEIGSNFRYNPDADDADSDRFSQAILVRAFSIDSEEGIFPSKCLPSGIAVSPSGDYLVVDSASQLGKVFNQSGYMKYSFGVGMFNSPWDIFVSESGKIVVSDSCGELKVFSRKGKFLQASELGYHLVDPKGIAYHPVTKELLVSDLETCCVYVHNPEGIVTDVLTINETENFLGPTYVHFDVAGNIYVSDTAAHKIHVFDVEKDHKFSYGSKGNEDNQLLKPASICTDRFGNILVADTGNSRVHLLDREGTFREHVLTWEDGLVDPQAMMVDNLGHLVVTEGTTGLLKVYAYDHLACAKPVEEKTED